MTADKDKVIPDDGTAAIRSDIERTRGDMSRTVNAIEERLSPAHLKEQFASVTAGITSNVETRVAELKESVIGGYHEARDELKSDIGRELRDAKHKVADEFENARSAVREATVGKVEHMVHDARESVTVAGTSILDTIRANPIPSALVGLGLGWLLFGGKKGATAVRRGRARLGPYAYSGVEDEDVLFEQPRRAVRRAGGAAGEALHAASEAAAGLGQRVQKGASGVLDSAQHAAHDASESVSHLAHDASESVGRAASGAGRQVMRAERSVESTVRDTMRDNPLVIGAVAVAVGAAIGLALPSSEVEDGWMGEAKEKLFHSAEEYAGQAIHRAEDAAKQLSAGDAGKEKSDNGSDDKPASSARNGQSGPSSSAAV